MSYNYPKPFKSFHHAFSRAETQPHRRTGMITLLGHSSAYAWTTPHSLPQFCSSYKDLLKFHLLSKTFPCLPGEILSPSPVPMALLAFHWSSNQSLVKALDHMCLSSHETINMLGTESRSHHLVIIMPATWPELRKDSVNVIELPLWKNRHVGSAFYFQNAAGRADD